MAAQTATVVLATGQYTFLFFDIMLNNSERPASTINRQTECNAASTLFVNKKSEITQQIEMHKKQGCTYYRTRLECNCTDQSNRRHGVVITNGTKIVSRIVRCKACAEKYDAKGIEYYKAKAKKWEELADILRGCYHTSQKSYNLLYGEYKELSDFRNKIRDLANEA